MSYLEVIGWYSPVTADVLLDLRSGATRGLGGGSLVSPLVFSPDGKFGIISGGCGSAGFWGSAVVGVDDGRTLDAFRGYTGPWAAHGHRILYLSPVRHYPETRDLFDSYRWVLRGYPARLPMWSPSGARVAFFRDRGPAAGLYVARVGRRSASRVLGFGGSVVTAAWSREGGWIAFLSGDPSANRSSVYFVASNGLGLREAWSGGAGVGGWSPLLWSVDSRRSAFVDDARVVRVVTPPDPAAVPVTTPAGRDICNPPAANSYFRCQLAWACDRLVFAAS